MKHGVSGYKLKRDAGSRKALLKGLVTSVIEHERVITTIPKAKAVQPLVDKMITLAKRDTLHSRRQAASFLETPAAVQKLFDKLGTRFGQRAGGKREAGEGPEQGLGELWRCGEGDGGFGPGEESGGDEVLDQEPGTWLGDAEEPG